MDLSFSPHPVPAPPGKWLVSLAKAGLMAIGVVYCLVGTLAFMAAFEVGGKTTQDTDQQGAFRFILEQPFGRVLLGLVAAGLACYASWRLLQAWLDPEKKGTSAKGIGYRIGYAGRGAFYAMLAFYAASQALGGNAGAGQGDSRQTLARELLGQPFGQWLVGMLALAIMLVGAYQIYRAVSGRYLRKIKASKLKPEGKTMLIRAGLVGYVARGLVWLLIGYLFVQAALQANAGAAGGTGKAFRVLEHTTYGSLLLGAVGLGLICYGVFMFVRARCEVIRAPG